jgi:hypothetical protein
MPHPVFDDLLEGARGRRRLQRRQELGEEARVPRRCHKDLPLRAAQQQHLLRGGRHRGGSRSRVGMGRRGAERNQLGVESRIVRALIESEAQLRLYGSTPSSDPSPRIQLPASWRNSPYMDRHRVRIRVQESSFRPVVDAGVLFRVGVRLEIARSDRQLHERDRIREGWGTRTFRGCRVAGKRA